MPAEDPLSSFIGNLAKKIQVAKDHRHIMEAVYASASTTEIIEKQEDPFASFLNKIGNTISAKLPPVKPAVSAEQVVVNQTVIQEVNTTIAQFEPVTTMEPDQPVKDLAQKIKDAIEKAKFKAQHPEVVEQEEATSIPAASTVEEPADKQITSYINELQKIKDTGTVKQQTEAKTTLEELKEYIDKAVYDYSRRILDLGGGGGSVAVQYANGGTMNGNLNVNGNYLSGGINLLDIFVTSESDNQTLTFNNSNYNLSISNGNTVNLSAINTTLSVNSGKYENTYTTTNTNSASWSSAYTNLVSNSAAYLSGADLSLLAATSASWNSAYTTLCSTSAFRISNTITSVLFPNGYAFSSTDTGKTYHVDTRSTPVSVLLPIDLPNDFSVTLVTLGTNNMHVSSTQVPMLCATGTKVNFAFASTFIYKHDNLLWGLGSLI